MAELDDYLAYARLADQLIERATKDQLADVTRLLALNIGWYQQRFGDVPKEALLKKVRAEALDDETFALLSSGMQNLVSALAEVTGLRDDLQDQPRHEPSGRRTGACQSSRVTVIRGESPRLLS
jgi:hypothetical protein